jgi:hypothetical protein
MSRYGIPVALFVCSAPVVTVLPIVDTSCPAPATVFQAESPEATPDNISMVKHSPIAP